MTALLDVNVLIALLDRRHVATDAALSWFERNHLAGWATCPITENGVLRILGHPSYPGGPGTVSGVADMLRTLTNLPGHVFWPDSLSLLDEDVVDLRDSAHSKHLTDVYLLALAGARQGKFVTFDRKIAAPFVHKGQDALWLLDM